MASKRIASLKRCYSDFEPFSKLKKNENSDIVEINLPGFSMSDFKVRLGADGTITVTGEHQSEEYKWSRFRKEFKAPEHCRRDKIYFKFEGGVLSIIMPKTLEFEGPSKIALIGEQMKNMMTPSTFAGLLLTALTALGAYALGGLLCK